MPARCTDKAAVQRLHVVFVQRVSLAVQLLHCLANFERSCRCGHGVTEADGDGIGNLARQLPEEASLFEAEDRAPDAVEVDGRYGRVALRRDALHDAFHAAAEGEQLADARDLPFGEDADNASI